MSNAQADNIRKMISLRAELLRQIEQERAENSATYVITYPDPRDRYKYEVHADHQNAR